MGKTTDGDRIRVERRHVVDEYNKTLHTPEQEREEQLIIADFRQLGYDIDNIHILTQEIVDDVNIAKLALDWLPKIRETGNRFYMIHVLASSTKVAQFKEEALAIAFEQYRNTNPLDHIIRTHAANIILKLADDSIYREILALAKNDTQQDLDEDGLFGMSERPLIVRALGKMSQRSEVVDELVRLLDDKRGGVCNEAIRALGDLRNSKALPYLTPLLHSDDSYVRNYAKTAIAKI